MSRFLAFSLFVSSFFWPSLAFAQEGGLVVSPAFQEIVLQEGESQKETLIRIENRGATPLVARLSVYDFGSLDESGGVAFLGAEADLEKKYALASWMRPETDTLVLAPYEGKDVKVTIENRDSLSPGGHYGALVFRAGNEEAPAPDSPRVSINQMFSSLFFVKKLGGEIYDLRLVEREFPKNPFFLPKKVTLRFENRGNVHIIPRGTYSVKDGIGRTVAKGTINQESGLILPESFRSYPVPLENLRVSWLPGLYTALLSYRYDGKEEVAVEERRFLFFPPAFLASLFGLALLGGGIFLIQRTKIWQKK